MDFQVKIEEMLYFYMKLHEKYNEEISTLPKGHLISCKRGNSYSFFHIEGSDYKRKGITKDINLIKGLCRKQFLEELLKRLEQNIATLRKIKLNDLSFETVYDALGNAYKRVPLEYYNDENVNWSNQPYEQSNYRPEMKRHTTSRGLKVRSKSEVIIAETLYAYDINFRYEEVMWVNEHQFIPDFTIMTPSNRMFYWEHCGMTNNPEYMRHHKWKMEQYEKIGIVPWKNLIVTYDTEEGIIDTNVIRSEILNKLK